MFNTAKTMQTWAKHADDLNITRPANRAEYETLLWLIKNITDSVTDSARSAPKTPAACSNTRCAPISSRTATRHAERLYSKFT